MTSFSLLLKLCFLFLFLAGLASGDWLGHLSLTNDLLTGTFQIGQSLNDVTYSRSSQSIPKQIEQYHNIVQDESNLYHLFNQYKQKFEKIYCNTEEEISRKKLFLDNVKLVLENNIKAQYRLSGYILAINWYSDRTLDESMAAAGSGNLFSTVNPYYKTKNDTPHTDSWTFDPYRKNNQVSPIISQEQCASAVYFVAAAVVESHLAIKGKSKLVPLSAQQLMDCSLDELHANRGCFGGGRFIPTFEYIKKHGITSMQNYPYLSKGATCDQTKEKQAMARINNWVSVEPRRDEEALRLALEKQGPIATRFHVNMEIMQYRGGIFGGDCDGGPNHAVLVVGYGYDSKLNQNFWILKNHYGTGWGEQGYFRIRRDFNNLCYVAGDAFYVE